MGNITKIKVQLNSDSDQRKESLNRLRLRAWVLKDEARPELVATMRLSNEGTAEIRGLPNDHASIEIEITDSAGRSLFGPQAVNIVNDLVKINLDEKSAARIPTATPSRPESLHRQGHFRVLMEPSFRFDDMSLSAATVTANQERELRKKLRDSHPAGEGWISVGAISTEALTALELKSAKLGFDGTFDLKIDPDSTAVGWVYAITGPETYVGFVPDKMEVVRRKGIAIFLPVEIRGGEDERHPEPTDPDQKDLPEYPLDAGEKEILDNPTIFSDDPGPFCKPFRNPERILGERRFQTILRSEQPEILGTSNKKVKPLPEYFDRKKAATGMPFFAANQGAGKKVLVDLRNTGMQRQIDFTGKTRGNDGRQAPGPNTLIDWENDVLSKQAITVAGGHILEWSVRWRSNGYSLGSVNHTLTLAPRQIKRIIKIDFERAEMSRREEITTVDDEVSQATDYTRDYTNAVRTGLREWAHGASESAAAGAGVGAGGLVGNAVIGGGAAAGGAVSASQQEGGRSAAATEEQNLRDAIRQHGESLRQLESTVISETNQRETTQGVSEILANPNYCHALTIVYYDILRHLRVDTELTGVSECLFVPFTITPFAQLEQEQFPGRFDVRRIIRHRDALKSALRDRTLAWIFPYLEDYSNFFIGSSVPAGRRMDQKVVSLRGSIDIIINVASPLKGDEDARAMEEAADAGADDRENAAHVVKWIGIALTPFQALGIGIAVAGAVLAKAAAHERDALFESEIAPNMVRKFVNSLELHVNGRKLKADFTLKGGYRKDSAHRVHFQVSARDLEQEGLTRADLEEVQIRASSRPDLQLPNHSVADVTAGRIQVGLPTYRRTLTDRGLHDDLVEIPTNADALKTTPGNAILSFPASNWEKENLRHSIHNEIERLVQHLDSHQFYYHKAIWWKMDPDEMFTIIDGYSLSATDRRSIASLVEYRPLGIVGNTLVFRVARGAFVGVNGMQSLQEARAFYEPQERNSDPMRVSLPTGGVYAQALMDECPACEEHAGSTDWVLDEAQLTPQELDSGLLSSRRLAPTAMTPSPLPDTLINLQNAPPAPAPSGLSDAFGAVTNANAFRDMAGLAQTQKNAMAALEAGASLAKTFGNLGAKQLNAERDAISRINQDPNLTPEDKLQLKQRHTVESSSNDPVEQAKAFDGNVEIIKRSTGGLAPANETIVKATNFPTATGDTVFTSGGSGGKSKGAKTNPFLKEVRGIAQRAMGQLEKSFNEATESNDEIDKIIQDAMIKFAEDELKRQGLSLVKKIPLGKALVVGAKISLAMADGIGQELGKVNLELSADYQRDLERSRDTGDGLSEEAIDAIRRLSRWQLNSVESLERIIKAGIRAAISKAISEAASLGGKVLEEGLNRFANDLAKNSEMVTFVSQMIDDLVGNPDSQERKGQAKMVKFLIERYVAQIEKSRFRNGLSDLVKSVKGDKPIAMELLAGMAHALKEATKTAAEPYALDLKTALLDRIVAVRKEVADDATIEIKNSSTEDVEVEGNEVRIPLTIQSIINAHQGVYDERLVKAQNAVDAFNTMLQIASQELETFVWNLQAEALGSSHIEFRAIEDKFYDERNKTRKAMRERLDLLKNAVKKIYQSGGDGPLSEVEILNLLAQLGVLHLLNHRRLERRSANQIDVVKTSIGIFNSL